VREVLTNEPSLAGKVSDLLHDHPGIAQEAFLLLRSDKFGSAVTRDALDALPAFEGNDALALDFEIFARSDELNKLDPAVGEHLLQLAVKFKDDDTSTGNVMSFTAALANSSLTVDEQKAMTRAFDASPTSEKAVSALGSIISP